MSDIYQERYLAHQEKKKEQLAYSIGEPFTKHTRSDLNTLNRLLKSRRSQRVFTSEEVTNEELLEILEASTIAPSSCNRHGIRIKVVTDRDNKALLSGILVGGVGWIQRASAIILFLADTEAYKSPSEKRFMPYCDVGFTAMSMWLKAEALDIGCAYINPNIREEHKEIFYTAFPQGLFVGALAIGKYDTKAKKANRPLLSEIIL